MENGIIFDKKNILVLGGGGFIGSHLCDELIKDSKVICLDDFSTGSEINIDHLLAEPNFEFIKHDISEPINLEKMPELQKFKIEFQGIQEIYNLACPMSPKDFMKNREKTVLANSLGVKNVLDVTLKYKAKLLHFSSSVVYGQRREKNEKRREDDYGIVNIASPRSCYDEGKRFAETMIMTYRDIFDLDAKILRLFRVYGPRMKLNDGQMVPDFVYNALDNRDLVIYGDKDFSSAFCYVSDCIDAALKAMDSEIREPLNIGSDVDINLTDLANRIIAYIGADSKIIYKDEMLFMTPLCLPDITKARNELGWMPVVTLEKGLERTIEDLRAAKGLKGVHNTLN